MGFTKLVKRDDGVYENVTRLPGESRYMEKGKADTLPLFPDDPSLAANRRVTITLMREDPPLPPNLKP